MSTDLLAQFCTWLGFMAFYYLLYIIGQAKWILLEILEGKYTERFPNGMV
jgi:hypothetical protein